MRTERTHQTGRNHRKRTSKLSRALRGFDWGTLFGLILFFPIGISRMWKARNRWPISVKYAISGVFLSAAAVSLVMMATTVQTPKGGIELCESEDRVLIYGPEAPEAMVAGYTSIRSDSGVLDEAPEEESQTYVYAAEDAKCYHRWDCKYAYASSSRITVYEAYCLGYKPCNICNPEKYDPMSFIQTADTSATETVADPT